MNVLAAKVNWCEQYDNNPNLELLVDAFPDHSLLRYEKRGSLYCTELDGYVSFYAYSRPDNGFGGRVFPITMVDGSKVDLKGPWSSRAGCMNDAGFKKCVDVSFIDDRAAYDRGYTFYAGHATLELCQGAVEKFLPDVCLVWLKKENNNEEHYTPVLKDGRIKPNPQTYHGKLENTWESR